MSVARCREINARLRKAGVTVHEWPGWDRRGNGLSARYEGGVVHHTATGFSNARPGSGVGNLLVDGRSDLSGPLCNWAGNEDGSVTCIAAFPANHAGASGGRSMGPLPVTSLFNPRVLGLEIVYPGTVPMRSAQYRTALIWARIVADVVGYANIQRIRAHAETSITGKWDPGDANGRTINMPAFRTAATVIKPEEDDLTPEDRNTLNYVRDIAIQNQQRIGAARAEVAALRKLVAAGKDMDPAELARLTSAALVPLVEDIAERVMGADNQDLAAEFLRQLRESLPATEGN